MSETTAQHASERFADLLLRRVRFIIQNGFHGEDDAVEAETALRRAFVDEGLLDRVGLLRRAQSFQCRNLIDADGAHRHHARAHNLSANDDGACAALRHSAPKLRTAKPDLITQNEQQRRRGLDVQHVGTTIDFE